jgi:L-lactate dehydrogenase complex protein LldF
VIVKNGYASPAKATGLKGMAFLFSHPRLYRWAGTLGRFAMRYLPGIVNNKFNPWYKQREMPKPPGKSFGEWYKTNRKNGG